MTREQESMRVTLATLSLAWKQHPSQRLCQLIVNATQDDPFFVEDEALEKALWTYMRERAA